MIRNLLPVVVVVSFLAACSGPSSTSGCDAGLCGGGAGGGTGGGGGDVDSGLGGGTGGGTDDAGLGGGAGGGGGDEDAGVDGGEDAGVDGGVDAGVDAGCGVPARLVIVSAPQTLEAGTCSTPVTVQLQDACGAVVTAPAAVPLTLSSSSPTMEFFTEGLCASIRLQWSIAAGTSAVTVHATDSAPGMPVMTVSSPGLVAGTQTFTFTCPTGQRPCNGTCIPSGGCCGDTDCNDGGVAWVCNTSSACEPPPCSGFPANCTTWDDRTASGASRTVTFGSSGYSPKCMRVTTSQDVTFSGSFTIHPLVQVCGPSDRQMTTTFGTTKVVRFPQFGTYGYRCANHPVFEQGAIRVP
jgi:plastocyanin